MAQRKPYPPNNFCPCKSGQKYKKCCQPKSIEYFIRPNGSVVKEAVLEGQQQTSFLKEKELFIQKYGRLPTEEEEGVLRLAARGIADLSSVIEADLIRYGASEETLYAFRKTGILVSRENESQISADELRQWDQAIIEYRAQKSGM